MSRRPLKRYLLSANAIQAHLLCIGLIVLLSISIWTGDAQPDYKWGLLFTIVIYPVLLGLLWWNDRLEEQEAIEHLIESFTEPERLRRKRRLWRRSSLVFFFGLAVAFVYAGLSTRAWIPR
jgi:Ca2+/Na+ antiporter